ncbi:hypothetical protein H5410_054823 [Solanum commersonii]|uniref:Uncharacterized protein n=1 Tax=Solanum commersonii TaxID=4109 RepID=A0A9J5WFY5_SOLCO|nr:hypothetical protein H5410_054823 [Solanum commersonii]
MSHDSVGACFTHLGWGSLVEVVQLKKPLVVLTFLADQGINVRFLEEKKITSVVEAIQFEKPLVLLTLLADQGINDRFLEEKNMTYSIPRNDWDGSFTPDVVIASLCLVPVEKMGEIYPEEINEQVAEYMCLARRRPSEPCKEHGSCALQDLHELQVAEYMCLARCRPSEPCKVHDNCALQGT